MKRIALPLIILVIASSSALAQASKEEGKASLKGLRGVGITIEDIRLDAQRNGLTTKQLQNYTEEKLRHAGIIVFSEKQLLRASGNPFLLVNVNTLYNNSGLYAFSIRITLYQEVFLVRNSDISVFAATWDAGSTGTVGAEKLKNLYEYVGEHLDTFIEDYLSVNRR